MDENEFERIEKYLLKRLNRKEELLLENDLNEGNISQRDIKMVRKILYATQSYGLKKELISIHGTLYNAQSESKSRVSNNWLYYSSLAATTIAIIVVLFIAFFKKQQHDSIFDDYFAPYPNYVTERGNEQDVSWYAGFEYYDQGEYNNALKKFEQGNYPKEQEMAVQFYKGVCYLILGNATEAIASFTSTSTKNNPYYQEVNWFLSLAFISNDEEDKAIEILKKIEPGEFKYSEAQEIIDLLKK